MVYTTIPFIKTLYAPGAQFKTLASIVWRGGDVLSLEFLLYDLWSIVLSKMCRYLCLSVTVRGHSSMYQGFFFAKGVLCLVEEGTVKKHI